MRTHVTFRTGRFDAGPLEPVPPEAYGSFAAPAGRDLVEWLQGALARLPGFAVDPPVQEEWGWRLPVRAGGQAVAVHTSLLAEGTPVWLIAARPVVTCRPRPFGRVDQHGLEQVIDTLHELLAGVSEIREVGWHEAGAFDRGVMDPAPSPFTPPRPERA